MQNYFSLKEAMKIFTRTVNAGTLNRVSELRAPYTFSKLGFDYVERRVNAYLVRGKNTYVSFYIHVTCWHLEV